MLTQKRVKQLFDYDPETGNLIWKVNSNSKIPIGSIAGTTQSEGYVQVGFNRKLYQAHRIIWLWYYGYMPEHDIDHIDRDKQNNRIDNLREVSRQCNMRNRGDNSNNTSGVKGVYWHTREGKWQSKIKIDTVSYFLGLYLDCDEAVCARLAGEQCLNWEGCDASSPAYQYVKKNIQGRHAMKTKELLETINRVIPAVDSKSVVAQTDHLIFSEGLLSGYNGKISISTPIETEIECSVPAEDLMQIIKSVDDEDVELTVEDGILHIISDGVRAAVSTEVEEEAALTAIRNFDLEVLYENEGHEVPENFIYGLSMCQYSASKNADDIDNLNCICFNGNQMTSGDRYRATIVELTGTMGRALIPLSSAIQLIKFNPESYIINNGWMHLIDDADSIFSLRTTEGDFPNVEQIITKFKPDVSVTLPSEMKDIALALGNIAVSPVDSFRVLQIDIVGDTIECTVEKSGVSATKSLAFEGNETDASFMISAPMIVSILDLTNHMDLNEKFAMFSDDTFKHIIMLVQREEE